MRFLVSPPGVVCGHRGSAVVPGAALLGLLAPRALLHDGLLPPARAEPPPVPVKLAALPLREVGLVLAAGAVRVRGVLLGGHEKGAGYRECPNMTPASECYCRQNPKATARRTSASPPPGQTLGPGWRRSGARNRRQKKKISRA